MNIGLRVCLLVQFARDNCYISHSNSVGNPAGGGGRGGEGLPYKSDGSARRKIKIEPLRETNVGVAQA